MLKSKVPITKLCEKPWIISAQDLKVLFIFSLR